MSTSSGQRRLDELLNHEFCPWANRWADWLKQPLCCLVLAALTALLCGRFVNPSAYACFAALICVLSVGAAWPWLSLKGLSGKVEFAKRRAREGELVTATLRVTNRWPWPAWGVSLERGFAAGPADADGIALARAGGWRTSEFHWEFRPAQRGVYPLEVPRLESRFPFGLMRAGRPVEVGNTVVVWPLAVPLAGLPDSPAAEGREGPLSDRRVGEFGDTVGTRAFRDGDSLRRVHWAQSARHQRLIVCERQGPAATAIRLFVDLSRGHHRGRGPSGTLEQALRIAASICESAVRHNGTVECRLGAQVFHVGGCASQLRRLLDAMAQVPLEGLPPGHGAARPRPYASETPPIVITTDLGLGSWSRAAGMSESRAIVVQTDGAEGDCETCEKRGAWISVSAPHDLSSCFARTWRRACNAI